MCVWVFAGSTLYYSNSTGSLLLPYINDDHSVCYLNV